MKHMLKIVIFLFIVSMYPGNFAEAHSALVKTLPVGGGTLKESPDTIELWFVDPVVLHSNTIKLTDSLGNQFELEKVYIDPHKPTHIIGNVQEKLPAGNYTVEANVIALDGDIVTEKFEFDVLKNKLQVEKPLKLLKHTPRDGQIIDGQPEKMDLWFNQSTTLTAIGVFDKNQQSITLKEPRVDPKDPNHLIVEFDEELEKGTYQVTWYARPSGSDIKILDSLDVFYFAVDEFTPIKEGIEGTPIETSWFPDVGLKQLGYWLIFVGLTLLFGASVFIHVVSKESKESKRWKLISIGLICITLLGTILLISQQRMDIASLPLSEFLSLKFIWVPIAQVILLLLGFLFKRIELVAYGMALVSISFVMGHASYPRYGGILTVMISSLHVVAASVWLGGLFSLLIMVKRQAFPELLKQAGAKFSKWAFWSLVVIILTGFIMTIQYVPSFTFESFLMSQWGRAITIKIGLTILIVGIGYLQRKTIKSLANHLATKFFRRGIVEISYGLVLLLFASILVVSTPSAAEKGVYPLKDSYEEEVKVDITPLKAGLNVLTLDFKKELDIDNVKLKISMPPENYIEYDAFKVEDGTFKITGNILHSSGSIYMEVEAKQANGDIRTFEYTIAVPGEVPMGIE